MGSGLKRRVAALETYKAAKVPLRLKVDGQALADRFEAHEQAALAFDAASIEERLATKVRELETLTVSDPWDSAQLHALRIALLEADIAELRGTSAEIVETMRASAHAAVSGRKYTQDAVPMPKPPAGSSAATVEDNVARARAIQGEVRDSERADALRDYRERFVLLEPTWPT